MRQMRPYRTARIPCCALGAMALTLACSTLQTAVLQAQIRPWDAHPQPAPAASALPATPPTSPPAAVPAPIAATPVANNNPAHRAEVTYSGGLIVVRANNSSLHQILRAISRRTGMTIVGGIGDDRVFGKYGPDTPSAVLTTLIDGTGTNMILRDGDPTHPMELVLTPQTDAASPGDDSIASDADDDPGPSNQPAQPAGQGRYATRQPAPSNPAPGARNQIPAQPSLPPSNVNGSPANTSPTASTFPTTNSVPIDSLPTPSTTPSSSGIVDAPNPPSTGAAAGPSSNAVPTPEQVYQQLLKMQQQQQQPAPGGATPPQ